MGVIFSQVMNKKLRILSLAVLAIAVSCSGATTNSPLDGPADQKVPDPVPGDGPDSGDTEVMPPIGLPAPTARPLAFAIDTESRAPIVGQFDFDESVVYKHEGDSTTYYLATSQTEDPLHEDFTQAVSAKNNQVQKSLWAQLQENVKSWATRLLSPVQQEVQANNGNDNISHGDIDCSDFDAELLEPINKAYCCQSGVTCWEIKDDKSVEAYPLGSGEVRIKAAITDGKRNLLENEEGQTFTLSFVPNPRLLYLGSKTDSIASVTNQETANSKNSYVLSGGKGKIIKAYDEGTLNGTRFAVFGSYKEEYEKFESDGFVDVKYNESNGDLSFLDPENGIGLKNISNLDNIDLDQTYDFQSEDISKYRMLKVTSDNTTRFIGEQNSVNSFEIFSVNLVEINGETAINSRDNRILFSWRRDPFISNVPYEDTLVYDVTENGCALALFRSADDEIYIRSACIDDQMYPEFGSNQIINSITSDGISDLIMYYSDTNPANNSITGNALMIDQAAEKLWFIDYFNPDVVERLNNQPRISEVSLENSISLGFVPENWTISGDNKKLFISHEDKITVVTLTDSNGLPLDKQEIENSIQTLSIKDEFNLTDENIIITTLEFRVGQINNNYLLIGLSPINTVSILSLDRLQELLRNN